MRRDLEATDALVIGGGPAGCAAAITCARTGLRTIILEREARNVGDQPPKPGETLHPGVEPILRELGVWAAVEARGFLRHMGHYVRWGGEVAEGAPARFQPFGCDPDGTPWCGLQAWRDDFDALLQEQACRHGVVLRRGQAVRHLVSAPIAGAPTSVRVCGAQTADSTIVTARWVIDATGAVGRLAREAGLATVEQRSPRLIARYGYVTGECPVRDSAPTLIADPDGGGWTWTARVRPAVYQWTRLRFAQGASIDGILPKELHGLRLFGPAVRGADVTWRRAWPAAGPGWFLVGDAAFVLDPASSHGVLKALMSGRMAAHCIAAMAQGFVPEEETVLHYNDWIARWFEADVARLTAHYAALRGFHRVAQPTTWYFSHTT